MTQSGWLLKKIKTSPHLLIFGSFILLRLFLLNINVAEWGDSYRILRASEYIRQGSYPLDEKRPPLFSIILAIRPANIDQILWGRGVMFVISVAAFLVFKKLTDLYIKDEKYKNIALIVFALNPVYLYWSLRIYADVPFSLLVLLSLYLYKRWELDEEQWDIFAAGLLAGLSVLTRFEGYLLVGSIGLALLLNKKIRPIFLYTLGVAVFAVPFLIWRNPITSSYLEEPGGRAYDLRVLATYILSLLFIFGFTSAFFFLSGNIKRVGEFLKKNLAITIFTALELVLILAWPAAVPRLLVPIIPLLTIILVLGFNEHFEAGGKRSLAPLLGLTTLLLVFIFGQYFLKLQFLILYKLILAAAVLLQVVNIYSIYQRKFNVFTLSLILSMTIWALSTVWLHKDNFISVKHAAEYASQNLSGVIGYNDVSSVSDWYLNHKSPGSPIVGKFYSYDKKADLNKEALDSLGYDYLLMTNEHNTDMKLDIESRPYLETIKEFSYEINGKVFFAKIISVKH